MTILDAYGLIAALANEPAADDVKSLMRSDGTKIVSTNIAETYDRLIRMHGLNIDEIDVSIRRLTRVRRLSILPVDEPIARRAGWLRAEHYDRRTRTISLADCIAASAAEQVGEALATPDPDLAAMARAIGLDVIALPDSSGKRP